MLKWCIFMESCEKYAFSACVVTCEKSYNLMGLRCDR
jgi:hypothetical protein